MENVFHSIIQGGNSFYLEFDKTLPESMVSGWATFGTKRVEVWKTYEGCILHGKEIPCKYIFHEIFHLDYLKMSV